KQESDGHSEGACMSEGFTMAELDYSFAPVPHNMATDRELNAEAFRLWSVIHLLKWNGIDPTPTVLIDAMGATERSIMRWLNQLEARQWIVWNRHNPNPQKRIVLRTNAGSPDAMVLQRIRELLAADGTTLEDIRQAITPIEPPQTDPAGDPNGSGMASAANQTDPTIRTDSGV